MLGEQSEVTLRVGISLGLESKPSDSFGFVQRHAYEGLVVWQDAFNRQSAENRTTRDGRTVSFQVVVFENYGRFKSSDEVQHQFLIDQITNISMDPTLDFVLPPVGSPWGTSLRILSQATGNVPFTIGIADSREPWYAVSGSYGAPTGSLYVMSSALPYLRLGGAKTAFVVGMIEPFQTELCRGFVDQAANNAIRVKHQEQVVFNYTSFGSPKTKHEQQAWEVIVDRAISEDCDVFVMCDYGEASEYVMGVFRRKGYMPKAVVLSYKYREFTDPSLAEYLNVPQSYDKNAGYPPQFNFVDAQAYDDLIQQKYGHPADLNNAQATLAGFLLSNAVLLAADGTRASVERALATAQFKSFMGTARFDPQRRQLMENLLVQRVRGKNVVVGPAVAARGSMVYPMPSWDERSFHPKWGHATEIAGVVLMVVAVAISAAWMVFLVKHWHHQVIVSSSPLFCAIILCGSVVIYASNVTWMPGLASKAACISRAWVLPVGLVLLFGALVAKTTRVYRLFFTNGLSVIKISNLQVMLVVLVLVLVQVLLSLLMQFVGRIGVHVRIIDQHILSRNFNECHSGPALPYIYGTNLILVLALLAYGAFLAIKVRKIPYRLYDESSIIHWATYNTVVFSVVAAILQLAVGSSQRFVAYIIITACMFLGPVITISLLFYSKYKAIYSEGDTTTTSSNSQPRSGSGTHKIPSAGSQTEERAARVPTMQRHNYSVRSINDVSTPSSHRGTNPLSAPGLHDEEMTDRGDSPDVAKLLLKVERLKRERKALRKELNVLTSRLKDTTAADDKV